MEDVRCSVCARTDENMKMCEVCAEAYCSVACQKWEWTQHNHAAVCMPIAKHDITPQKARKILHEGRVHGRPLTDRQRRYFGWKSNQ